MDNDKLKKTFLNIDKRECKLASMEMINNAKNHIELAKKLHLSHDYGLGIFHLIIGSEETVKALGSNIKTVFGKPSRESYTGFSETTYGFEDYIIKNFGKTYYESLREKF
ncbi:MAG: hypothetical protein JXR65_04670 [Bacteroidales bacterium]|nr:hypothetical protein [Bacteroidales bacterium]